MTKTTWNPVELPFRLIVTAQSSQAGCHGWATRKPRMFATLAEAVAEAEKPQGRGVINVRVDEAMNPETWMKNGHWKNRYRRDGRSKRVPTSAAA